MVATKEEVISIISNMPVQIEIDDLMYKLYVFDKIKKGITAADNGQVLSIEEMEEEINRW